MESRPMQKPLKPPFTELLNDKNLIERKMMGDIFENEDSFFLILPEAYYCILAGAIIEPKQRTGKSKLETITDLMVYSKATNVHWEKQKFKILSAKGVVARQERFDSYGDRVEVTSLSFGHEPYDSFGIIQLWYQVY